MARSAYIALMRSCCLLILWTFCSKVVAGGAGGRINNIAGPWKSVIESVQVCRLRAGELREDFFLPNLTAHYSRAIKRKLFSGTLIAHKVAERRKYQLFANAAKWDRVAGWKENFFVAKLGDPCELLERAGSSSQLDGKSMWSDLQKSSTPTIPAKCPIPKVNYSVMDWDIIAASKAVPVLPYGRYRTELRFQEPSSQTTELCVEVIASVLPIPF